MATLTRHQLRRVAALAGVAGLAGCDDLVGLAPSSQTPLASIHVRVTGDVAAVRDPAAPPAPLQVSLQWATQSQTDASCVPPAESPAHAAVIAAGCYDPLAFAAGFGGLVGVAVDADGTATLDVLTLPGYLVGDSYSQIAYASVFAYEVQDGNPSEGIAPATVIYGASFSSMAKPDTRLAFRHGGYDDQLAFYPRRGCEAPPEGFSLVSAGGFTVAQAIDAQARGELPSQNPADCQVDTLDREVEVAIRPPEEMHDLSCPSSAAFYGPPGNGDVDRFDPSTVRMACTSIPDFGRGPPGARQAVAASIELPPRGCRYIQHFILRGCYLDPYCETPDWDVPPPSWWPCPVAGAP